MNPLGQNEIDIVLNIMYLEPQPREIRYHTERLGMVSFDELYANLMVEVEARTAMIQELYTAETRTPRTDKMVSANSDPSTEEYADLSSFCRILEIERDSLEYQLSYANSRIQSLEEFCEGRQP